MLKRIIELAISRSGEITGLRRHFHRNPEIGWEEVETTKKIAEVLEGLGLSIVKQGFGGTESGLKSGAAAMVDEGALDGVGSVGGLHVWSKAPTG